MARLNRLARDIGGRPQLARAAKIPVSTLAAYFAGVEPTRGKILAISKAANVRIGWLLSGEEPMR
jgi:hypothetical protein